MSQLRVHFVFSAFLFTVMLSIALLDVDDNSHCVCLHDVVTGKLFPPLLFPSSRLINWSSPPSLFLFLLITFA